MGKDARYNYYLHGPLARTVLGEQMVQGIDYAYTLQGWLKGVNATNLNPDYDMGADGKVGTANQYTARDAFGFNLNYYANDYTPVGAGVVPFPDASGPLGANHRPLYNGNINSMAVNIGYPNATSQQAPQLYNYRYDQLNRITSMDVFRCATLNTNSWSGMLQMDDYKESVKYDANGNILKYVRRGFGSPVAMDSLFYNYTYSSGKLVNNKLNYVNDKIATTAAYTDDLEDQPTVNYVYDASGNLIQDSSEKIRNIEWNVYGKIKTIYRGATAQNPVTKIEYKYDPAGNRILKGITKGASDSTEFTAYVRDASGNIMATYFGKGAPNGTISSSYPLLLQEQNIYGSSRVGVLNMNVSVGASAFTVPANTTFTRGNKFFELTNHLGNVLVTISDKKAGVRNGTDTTKIDYYNADVITANDYYPFGMLMPGRTYQAGSGSYRYSINGQEKTPEIAPNTTTALYWEYDARIGRRWNLDPKSNFWESRYSTFKNNPILFFDKDGDVAGPGDRAKEYATKNKLKNFNIINLKGGRGASVSWVDKDGNSHTVSFLTKRSDISDNSTNINGSQYEAMSTVEGIQKVGSALNWTKNPDIGSLKGRYNCSPYGGYVTDTKESSADRFNMYVDNSVPFYVDESQATELVDYEKYVVDQLMRNFVKGTGAEFYIFPTNGRISSQFLGSDILNEALRRFNAGEVVDNEQISFGGKELAKDYARNGTFYSITGFVGSASVTIKKVSDKTIMVTIFNITSITSGDLFKNPSNDKNWPKAFIRGEHTPYGNIGQVFSLILPIK